MSRRLAIFALIVTCGVLLLGITDVAFVGPAASGRRDPCKDCLGRSLRRWGRGYSHRAYAGATSDGPSSEAQPRALRLRPPREG